MTLKLQMRPLAVLLCLAALAPMRAQTPADTKPAPEMVSHDTAPTFSSKVNLVLVPVVVRDNSGKAVGNLTKDDFRLFDKGKPQVIARFSVESIAHAAKPASEAVSAAEAEVGIKLPPPIKDLPERYVAYVFDDLNVKIADWMRVQQSAKKHFTERLQPTDRAAIFTTSGQNQLDFTGDKDKLMEALMRIHPKPMFAVTPNQCPDLSYYMADRIFNKNDRLAMNAEVQETIACMNLDPTDPTAAQTAQQSIQAAAPMVLNMSDQGSRITLNVLRDVVRSMGAMPGQRLVVLASPGFLTLQSDSISQKMDILDRAARENVVINSIDVRGLWTDPTLDASRQGHYSPQTAVLIDQYEREAFSAQSDVLAELAEGTGGTFFQNNNDLVAGLNRLASAPEYVYLLAFTPSNLKSDGSFHKLKVDFAQKQALNIQARRGYFAPRKGDNPEDVAKTEIEDAVFSRDEMHELPVDLHTQFFKPDAADAKLTVLARVDLKGLRFNKAEGRNENNLTVVSVLFDQNGKYVTGNKKVIEMKLKDDTLERLSAGITVKSSFDVKPGTYMVRLVVRDDLGRMMAAANGAVDIP